LSGDKLDDQQFGPISLRRAVPADAQAFFELDRLCFAAEIAYSLDEFRSLLRSRTVISAVAEAEGQLAGFAIAQPGRVNKILGGQIVTIDVAPAYRRLGIGRLLMGRIELDLGQAGCRWIRLEVAADNAGAQEFYAGLGFAPVGRIADYYYEGLDAVVMEKPLEGRSGAGSSRLVL
jgi:ribosomal-protein-alanine N-acetyltransferase